MWVDRRRHVGDDEPSTERGKRLEHERPGREGAKYRVQVLESALHLIRICFVTSYVRYRESRGGPVSRAEPARRPRPAAVVAQRLFAPRGLMRGFLDRSRRERECTDIR